MALASQPLNINKTSKERAFPWLTVLILLTKIHLNLANTVRDKWLVYLNLCITNSLFKRTEK